MDNLIITVVTAVFASTGFWAFVTGMMTNKCGQRAPRWLGQGRLPVKKDAVGCWAEQAGASSIIFWNLLPQLATQSG